MIFSEPEAKTSGMYYFENKKVEYQILNLDWTIGAKMSVFANSLSSLLLLHDKLLSNNDMLLAKRPKRQTPDQTNNKLAYFSC